MIEEPFAVGRSWVYRMDPRHRVVLAIVFSVIVAVSEALPALCFALGFSLILAAAARLDPLSIFQRLRAPVGFLVLLWIVLPFSVKGSPVFDLGPLSASEEGILLSLQISIKSMAILVALVVLTATMPLSTLGHALLRIKMPEKIVYLLLMTYRYTAVLETEYHRLVNAARVRGFRPATTFHTYRTYAYLVGMLFVRSFSRAERVYQAMKCRGFKGRFYSLHDFRADRNSLIFFTVGLICTSMVLILELMANL